MLWEVIVLVILKGGIYMNMCISEWLPSYRCLNLAFESVRFLCVVLDEE